MKIAIGCDHIVTDFKNEIRDLLIGQGHEVIDVGTYDKVRTHYPIFGKRIAELVVNDIVDIGIAICGTGVGISNAAQKIQGSRVALVSDVLSAVKAREVYDANVISFGGRVVGLGTAMDIIQNFIETPYNEENQELIEKINKLGNNKPTSFKKYLEKWDQGLYTD